MALNSDFESRVNAMIAASDGKIWVVSGYRDTATQERLWKQALKEHGSEAEARKWVAPPGHSYHEKGLAVDLGGDLKLAAQLAPQFGLYRPLSNEDWHFEPIGSRDENDDPLSYTTPDTDSSALFRDPSLGQPDWGTMLSNLLGLSAFTGRDPKAIPELALTRGGTDELVTGNPGFAPPEPDLSKVTPGPDITVEGERTGRNGRDLGDDDLGRFMRALRDVESGGDYKAIGIPTRWGTAKGAYQYLDGTWDNYKGYPTADAAPPEIQDEKARLDMQRYYSEYGDWDSVAAAWYSGPAGNWQSGEVRTYVSKVKSRL